MFHKQIEYLANLIRSIPDHVGWLRRVAFSLATADKIADASDTVVFSWDIRSNKVWVIAGSHGRFGIARTKKFHSPDWWLSRIHTDDQPRIKALLSSVRPDQQTIECAYRIRRDDGTWLEVLDRCYLKWKREKLIRIIGVTSDIALLVATKDELEQERSRAVAASEAKSRFLANMSHELRTPLGAIVSSADLACHQDVPPTDREKYLGLIIKNSQRMLSLVDDLLDLAKVESGYLRILREPVDIASLVSQAVDDISGPANEKGINLDCKFLNESHNPSSLPSINTDANRLRQILANLIGNAVKFTEKGGVRITAQSSTDRKTIEIRVADSGIGISPEDSSRLFQPFEQLSPKTNRFPGTGLGLSLSRNLAKLLGGELTLEHSARDIGSTFLLRLPLDKPAKAHTPVTAISSWSKRFRPICPQKYPQESIVQAANQATVQKLKQKKVILVDDAEDNRKLLARILQLGGAEVSTAANGQAALDIITELCRQETSLASMPVVLMDIEMPVMNGCEALAEIRRRNLPVKVVALTAHAMTEHRKLYLDAGFDGYLSKPVDQSSLVNEVLRLYLH